MPSFRIAAVLLALTGCKSTPVAEPDGTITDPVQTQPSDMPIEAGGDMKDAVSASNRFGLALYQELRAADGNLAYSPASISVALAMTYAGAKGDTAEEMKKTLALPKSTEALNGGWASVLNRWQNVTGAEIAVANRLFGDKKYTFEPAYLKLTGSRYGAPLESVDFAGAPQVQRKRINDWVADKTRDRIKDLVPPDGVTSDTRMALVNAMYFKAKWLTPFDTAATSDGAFTTPGGSAKVPMMQQTEHMQYGEVGGIKLAQRSYEDPGFATLFVLPAKGTKITKLEKQLDADLLETWTAALRGTRVSMKLPRFKIDPPASVELSAALIKMDMRKPFERLEADFTGITNPPSPADRLFIEKVFHKAFVAMDEAGTEAAAATAVMMGRAGGPPAKPKAFHADRPFLFFVRDVETGLVMFAGRVVDPR